MIAKIFVECSELESKHIALTSTTMFPMLMLSNLPARRPSATPHRTSPHRLPGRLLLA